MAFVNFLLASANSWNALTWTGYADTDLSLRRPARPQADVRGRFRSRQRAFAMPVLRPMTRYEYAEWLKVTIPAYAADKVASGQWSEEESLQLSRKEYEELLPQGFTTPDNFFYTIEDSDSMPVGVLWFAVKAVSNGRVAYVYDVEVQPQHRRKGNAYRAFCALEQEARKLGLSGIALHVFGHNVDAQALYAKLGFRPTNINLFKPVSAVIV